MFVYSAVHGWLTEVEKGNEVAAVFFDLTKAFDFVPHRHLINKLETIGLDVGTSDQVDHKLPH